jgi:hypothetical protein
MTTGNVLDNLTIIVSSDIIFNESYLSAATPSASISKLLGAVYI